MMKNLFQFIQSRLVVASRQRSYWSSSSLFCPNCSRNVSTTTADVTVTSITPKQDSDNKKKTIKKKQITKKSPKKTDNAKTSTLPASSKLTLNYIEKHGGIKNKDLFSLLPKQSLRPTATVPTSVYLIDENQAKKIGNAVKLENVDKASPVLELHAGLGLLTLELVKEIGFKHVTCLENDPNLAKNLASRFNVTVIDCSVDHLPRYHHMDKQDGGERINSILTSISTEKNNCAEDDGAGTNNESKRQLYIVGAIPHISTINFLIRSFVTKRVFFEDDLPWSGVTLFAALGPKAAHICTATPDSGMVAYRPTSVFFQTLFTFKDLGTISRKAFIPWETEDVGVRIGPKKRRLRVEDPTVLRLMRVDINRQVQDAIGKDNLFAYWYFVRQHLYARSSRIIPELERWIPGCGVRLIKQGFTIFSQFGTLKPDEILNLYLQFVSWPEFTNSSFLNALEKFQTRLELSEEEENK